MAQNTLEKPCMTAHIVLVIGVAPAIILFLRIAYLQGRFWKDEVIKVLHTDRDSGTKWYLF